MQKISILTVDLEDWFHILNHDYNDYHGWSGFQPHIHKTVEWLLGVLERYNTTATFFAIGWMAWRYPELIDSISRHGHEVGIHTYYHQRMDAFGEKSFYKDLINTSQVVESITGIKPVSFRAPGFSVNRINIHLLWQLKKLGVQNDSSVVPGWHTYGHFPDFPYRHPARIQFPDAFMIREFPINSAGIGKLRFIYAGGGYFRLMPYNLTRRMMKTNAYNMTYFHPREFHGNSPRVPDLSPVRRWKLYQNMTRNPRKFEKLLADFSFTSIEQASQTINWQKTPLYKVADANSFKGSG